MIARGVHPVSPHSIAASASIAAEARAAARTTPTVWGLSPVQLHDRFWAHRGVQVVRPGEPEPISPEAQLYLLTDERALATFEPGWQLQMLSWSSPDLVYIRVRDVREREYRERVVTDAQQNFVRFERIYTRSTPRLMRAAFTTDRAIAQAWRSAPSGRDGWPALRRRVPRERRSTLACNGVMYDRASDADLAHLVRDLTRMWSNPGAMIRRARAVSKGVWADGGVSLDPAARFAGSVWVGAGRTVDPLTTVIGPFVLWDDPAQRPAVEPIAWPAQRHIDLPRVHRPTDSLTRSAKRVHGACKRAFDIVFSIVAIAVSLPLYPLIMLAIWLEDARPFFFAHRRETTGGREFACLKFRSMYRDADKMRQRLEQAGKNQADGPQFFMENDVRVTRVGRFLRRTRLDELPQFFNVLRGHMSVVGPRPSPFNENQFCPAWREARLSVKPGITGLWQVKRTRIPGADFQEWIKYDIEYVENISFSLDLMILFLTVFCVLGGVLPRRKRAYVA
ncbi:MAG TPA: sugar transferase [Tepidisphaeraceae bacterium]|jgi:lipopolysaccharide/colanic/teichoic acid biosynthesis glycosyltransferase